MPIFNDYANGKPLKEIDYFIDKIYVDDDGNLSFVIKRYGKDGTKLVETSADELIENQGFTRFDNFTLCSTQNPREKSPGFFFAVLGPFWPLHSKSARSLARSSSNTILHMLMVP